MIVPLLLFETAPGEPIVFEMPLLYQANIGPSEKFNIAEEHQEVIAEIRRVLDDHVVGLEVVGNQLGK